MSSAPDLFVVCKQCGSEVSPYITECPYCGHRLRRRAPDLPREKDAGSQRWLRLPRFKPAAMRAPRRTGSVHEPGRWAAERPYATIGLVAVSCVVWVVLHAKPTLYLDMTIFGPLRGDWWKLLTSQFAYGDGLYEFVTLVAIAIFGWLLERRHGPAVVLALALGAGVAGALVASAVYAEPIVSGGNAAALGLLVAWAVPDLRDARAGHYYEGDLLGVAAIAALLLAMPYARPEASWLAGVVGGVTGLVLGFGMYRSDPAET
jgi:membrane associated rhomboid family serine protease